MHSQALESLPGHVYTFRLKLSYIAIHNVQYSLPAKMNPMYKDHSSLILSSVSVSTMSGLTAWFQSPSPMVVSDLS